MNEHVGDRGEGVTNSELQLAIKKRLQVDYTRSTRMPAGITVTVSTVRVMAFAEGYAMVRYHGCNPFVAEVKQLSIKGEQP